MAIGENGEILGRVRTLFGVGAVGDLSDGQLLERFATGRGEAAELAFAALVERHGSMVLRVCRGVLSGPDDAQDAFQATFLVLIQRRRSLWVRDSLGPWLHQVAHRTASCLRTSAARRRRLERGAAGAAREGRAGVNDELVRVLHEELGRLPDRYRAPAILCDLEGTTHEQAARHLGWPIGTVKSRLTRARELLRDRLRRRGFGPDAGLLAASLRPRGIETLLPPMLVDSTTRVVAQSITSRAIVPGSAASLAQEVLRAMSIAQWWKVAATLAAVVATVSGVDALAQKEGPGAGPRPAEKLRSVRAEDLPAAEVKPGKLRVVLVERGVVEAARVEDVLDQVEGTTTILSILPEGSKVKKGDKVGQLDSATLRDILKNQKTAVAQAEANFATARLSREAAETALREYTEGTYKAEHDALKGAIVATQSAIQGAEGRLERTRQARKRMDDALAARKGAATPADVVAELDIDDRLDAAGRALTREKLALESAQAKLALLQKYTEPRIRKDLLTEMEGKKATELAKKGALSVEKDKEAKLERQIARSVLVAPSDGAVVYANDPGRIGGNNRVQIEEGATVRERQLIFSVVALDGPMVVNAKVKEANIDRVRPGQRVRIKVDAFSNETLTGAVVRVSPLPDANTFFEKSTKVYATRVRIETGLRGLRPGMTAEVEIPIVELDDVLSVPCKAVLHFDDKDRVAVKGPGGGFEWRDVTAGETDGTSVEIKQGLRGGESVILDPAALMSEAEKRAKFGVPASPPPGRPLRRGRRAGVLRGHEGRSRSTKDPTSGPGHSA